MITMLHSHTSSQGHLLQCYANHRAPRPRSQGRRAFRQDRNVLGRARRNSWPNELADRLLWDERTGIGPRHLGDSFRLLGDWCPDSADYSRLRGFGHALDDDGFSQLFWELSVRGVGEHLRSYTGHDNSPVGRV